MIQHIWSILCKQSIIDRETNGLTIIDIFEQLRINASVPSNAVFPIKVPISYELVSMWIKHDKNKKVFSDIEITISDPDGNVVSKHTKQLIIPKNIERMRSRIKISGFEVTKSGVYEFRIAFKEEGQKQFQTAAELPLYVYLNKKLPNSVN